MATESEIDNVNRDTLQSEEPIYLLIRGQSNALGTPEPLVSATYTPDKDVKYWHKAQKKWVVAELGALETRGKAKSVGSYSFALSAAKTLHAHYNRPVHYIVNARSRQKFDAWLREENSFFDKERRFVKLSGANNVIVLSHQGESHHRDAPDVFVQKIADYESLLEAEEWFSGTILHGELLQGGRKSSKNPQIGLLKYVVSSAGLTSHDGVHFDSESLKEFGKRYANVLIEADVILD